MALRLILSSLSNKPSEWLRGVSLYLFQVKAVSFGLTRKFVALLMEQGTGKTIVALVLAVYRFRKKKIKRVLVVSPRSVTSVWSRAIERFVIDPHYVVLFDPRRIEDAEDMIARGSSKLGFLLVGFDMFWRNVDWFIRQDIDQVFVDESQKIKNRQSKRSKAMMKLAPHVKYRGILSGTPMPHSELDIFSQYQFLDPSIFTDWDTFENRFLMKKSFVQKFVSLKQKLRPTKRREFNRIVHQHAYRITAEEALPWLPKLSHQEMIVTLDGKARRHYQELENDFITYVKSTDTHIATPMAVTRMLRLQQLTGGWLVGDDDLKLQVGTHKRDALNEFLEDWNDRIVIFARFRSEIEDIAEVFKKQKRSFITYHGDTKDRSIWAEFQKPKGPQGFIAQIATGGVGIELFASRLVMFYSKSFSWDDYDQALKRVYRNGQTRPVIAMDLIADETIDIYLQRVLKRRGKVARDILDVYRNLK